MTGSLLRIVVAFLPVLAFLGVLIYLDSYKLVRFRDVIKTIVVGGAVAGLSYWANLSLIDRLELSEAVLVRYVAPPVEELLKAAMVIWLIRTDRVGFLVDSAIVGFAAGAGFAVVENAYYLQVLPDANIAVWVLRGFGTAVMHGGATAIFAIVAKALSERERGVERWSGMIGGLLAAIALHSAYNHFFLGPLVSPVLVLLVLPLVIAAVFRRSERALREWLDVGFDADTELLELIHSGGLSDSPVGRYLQSLKERFRGEVVADMLCYLRLHVELALRAKGLLMMRQAGFSTPPDDDVRAGFDELRYLEGSIGRTGKLAMAPFLRISGKELWQIHMLQ